MIDKGETKDCVCNNCALFSRFPSVSPVVFFADHEVRG